jgi:hypothetical protein
MNIPKGLILTPTLPLPRGTLRLPAIPIKQSTVFDEESFFAYILDIVN